LKYVSRFTQYNNNSNYTIIITSKTQYIETLLTYNDDYAQSILTYVIQITRGDYKSNKVFM